MRKGLPLALPLLLLALLLGSVLASAGAPTPSSAQALPGKPCSLTLTASPTYGGTFTLGGTVYHSGSALTVTCGRQNTFSQTPTAGWRFSAWTLTGTVSIWGSSIWVNATGATVLATYVQHPAMSLVSSPATCGPLQFNGTTGWANNSLAGFDVGTYSGAASAVALTCSGYVFLGWSGTGGVSPSSPTTLSTPVVLTNNGTLYANWTPTLYVVTVGDLPLSFGSVQVGAGTYYNNQTLSLRAGSHALGETPNAWARFSGWQTGQGVSVGSGGTITVTGAGYLNASFLSHPSVTILEVPSSCPAITFNGSLYVSGSTPHFDGWGATYAISAPACAGSAFLGWTTAGSLTVAAPGSASTTATLSGNATLTATWKTSGYIVNITIAPPSGGPVTIGSSTYYNGTALPLAGGTYALQAGTQPWSVWEDWGTTGGLSVASTTSPSTTLTVNGNGTLTSNYAMVYQVMVYLNNSACSSISMLSRSYTTNTTVTFVGPGNFIATASICAGYTFGGWTATGGISVGSPTSQTTSIAETGNGTLTLLVFPIPPGAYTIEMFVNNSACSTITFQGLTYSTNQSAAWAGGTTTAKANVCASDTFLQWTSAGGVSVASPTSLTPSVTVTGDGSLSLLVYPAPVASYSVQIYVSPAGAGAVSIDGTLFPGGSGLLLSAGTHVLGETAWKGYTFTGFSGSGSVGVSSSTLWVNGTGSVTANFVLYAWVTFEIYPAACGNHVTVNGFQLPTGVPEPLPPASSPFPVSVACSEPFKLWSGTGGVVAALPYFNSTNMEVTGNGTFTAVFSGSYPYQIIFTTNPATCGSITFNRTTYANGAVGSYPANQAGYTVSTSPCPGMTLAGIRSAGAVYLSGPYATVYGNGSISASFVSWSPGLVNLLLLAQPATCGPILLGGVAYPSGTAVAVAPGTYTLSIGSCVGYEYWGWTASPNATLPTPTPRVTTVTVNGNATLTASFALAPLGYDHVLVEVNPTNCPGLLFGGNFYGDGDLLYAAPGSYALVPAGCPAMLSTPTYTSSGGVAFSLSGGGTFTVSGNGTLSIAYTAVLWVDFTTAPLTATTGRAVNFTASIHGGVAPFTVTWIFGDGARSVTTTSQTTLTIAHTYLSPGNATLELWVNDSSGQSWELPHVLVVSGPSLLGNSSKGPSVPFWVSVLDSPYFLLWVVAMLAVLVLVAVLARRRGRAAAGAATAASAPLSAGPVEGAREPDAEPAAVVAGEAGAGAVGSAGATEAAGSAPSEAESAPVEAAPSESGPAAPETAGSGEEEESSGDSITVEDPGDHQEESEVSVEEGPAAGGAPEGEATSPSDASSPSEGAPPAESSPAPEPTEEAAPPSADGAEGPKDVPPDPPA